LVGRSHALWSFHTSENVRHGSTTENTQTGPLQVGESLQLAFLEDRQSIEIRVALGLDGE
jgi:hypothetical protein